MKFFRYDDRLVESFEDCEEQVVDTLINYDQITCVKILENVPYFTVYFSTGMLVEIDKIHLEKFLEGIKGV